jgi:putative NADH-flavin reductase
VKVAIFGASGATGQHLVRQALDQGYEVTAFARSPSRFSVHDERIRTLRGDVTDQEAVRAAIAGQDAVLCALGASTPLRRDPTLVAGIQNIVAAMTDAGVRRLVYLSFCGVRAARWQLTPLGRYIVAPIIMRNVVADHEAKERIIQESQLEYVIVRPPRLTNGPARGTYRSGTNIRADSLIPHIARADVESSC